MTDPGVLLAAYDAQLRGDAETSDAARVTTLGPLSLATYAEGRGFISYRDLDGADEERVRGLVAAACAHYADDPKVTRVEWKTRGHDRAPGLHEALLEHGFRPEEPESIMIGEARALAVDVPLPEGVALRRVTDDADVWAMSAVQGRVFDDPHWQERAKAALRRVAGGDDVEMWVAEVDGQVVSAGRLEPVPGSDFAGLWGGVTLPKWRGRGIYRGLTAARAKSALRRGKTLLNSDSTEFSRPILERSGLLKVSTTTPYLWRR